MKSKRLGVVSDLHAGHRVGLTPQGGHWRGAGIENGKYQPLRRECWNWYKTTIKRIEDDMPCSAIAVVGDCCDGKGSRSGGTELLVSDPREQAKMATEALLAWKCDRFFIVRGTPFHAGMEFDWENMVVDGLRLAGREASIDDHAWLDINGCVFDIKHHVRNSSAGEKTRYTAVAGAREWNKQWHLRGNQQPLADVVLRGHVHSYKGAVDATGAAFSLPALQAAGSKFGAKLCESTVDYGMMHFDIDKYGEFSYKAHLLVARAQKVRSIKV